MSEKEYDVKLIEYEWPNGSKRNGYTHELTISSSSLMKLVETQGESLEFSEIAEVVRDENSRTLTYRGNRVTLESRYYQGLFPGISTATFSRYFVVSLDDCIEACAGNEELLSLLTEKQYVATFMERQWSGGCIGGHVYKKTVTISTSSLIELVEGSANIIGECEDIEYDEENRMLTFREEVVNINNKYYQGPYAGCFDTGFNRELVVSLDDCIEACAGNEDAWDSLEEYTGEDLFFVESELSLEQMKEMVEIEPGTFQMGAQDEEGGEDNEKPRHEVTLTRRFSAGMYLVTQTLWESVMEDNPSNFQGRSRPVEEVSWLDCIEFCNKLSESEGLEKAYTTNGEEVQCNFDSNGYRLPTEAEWEYCARANQDFKHSGSTDINEVAWYEKNAYSRTQGVGQKKPNGFGLYDMTGNVWEWCWDWMDDTEDYSNASTEDPTGPSKGSGRLYRGGSGDSNANEARLSFRYSDSPSSCCFDLGIRLVRTIL